MNQEHKENGWEKELVEKLAFAAVNEQRKARRWGIFFKMLTFTYLIAILAIAMYPRFKTEMSHGEKKHAAIIDVQGVIAENEAANADAIIEGLRKAVKDDSTQGIILNINSPGGSPVQSAYVYDEIRRLKEKHPDMPIYSVVSDICASGGYYIASASDKIYVNQASIIGSIGVIMNGFGFVNVLDKLGVERRLLTAGSHKAMLDPFSPVKESEAQHMQSLLNQVHRQFIDAVKTGRGDRLAESPEMFSGLVWTGTEGVKLGLADDFGSVDSVAKDVLGVEDKVNFTPQERFLERLVGKFGASFGHALGTTARTLMLQ
ncbi:signal peptide peptidase SppA [Methylomarinum sp. Ch1-1]|uniref:Signal peptide peptidase SppA n=2 Tax=Methylomarinum roseum TaxID=3067653 RepID=A0AAU7NZQ0_9GAMM|nr:signal peptide peptidase SppA [Methylomarinum sp. Ch1-1]MDP4521105.1 signal peptide peptidase SppA [Methylomarinum sp. Ch1-1]